MSGEVADLAFKETEQFRVNFVNKNVRTESDAVALASMFLYEATLILRAVGGPKYAAQVLYATADEMATREDSA